MENKDEGIVEHSLYKGKVKVRFYGSTPDKPNRHMYFVNNKRVTGVTTFLNVIDKSTGLIIWATELFRDYLLEKHPNITEEDIHTGCSLHRARKQEAADIGTKVHEWCELYVRAKIAGKKGQIPDMPEDKAVQIGVNAFLDWERANKVKFLSTERLLYSKKHDYVGTLDIEAMVNGKLALVDLKTGNSLYNTVLAQTAAYQKADEEESGRKYETRWAIRLAKETEEEYIQRMLKKGKDSWPDYQVFEAKELTTDVDEDFKAFLNAKELHKWNTKTDFYAQRAKV